MRAILFFTAWVSLPLACSAPPPATDAASSGPEARGLEPASAEWLYATEGVPGGRKGECRGLVPKLESELRCKGALCNHGASLAKDWLRVCKTLTPELASDVERHAAELGKKSRAAPTACEQEVEGLLKTGCGRRDDCGEAAQSWATRCSEWSSPLIVRMLEVMVERGGGERTRIDGRGCPDLLADVHKAGACVQQFVCQDGFGAIDTYRARCVSAQKPITVTAATLELAVRSGASPSVEPLAFAEGGKLDPALVPLRLEDGSGAVVLACGKRASSVETYLGLRKTCTDAEITLTRRYDGPKGPVLRVGRLPHLSDAAFLVSFPSLRVEGEPKARYQAALPAFLASVDLAVKTAADPKQIADATRILIGAIEKNIDAVRNSADFETAFKDKDAALVPLFLGIGEAKRKLLHGDLPAGKLAPALHRGKSHPLADIDVEGRVRVGSVTIAASIELGALLPKADAVYQQAIAGRWKLLERKKVGAEEAARLALAADAEASRCGQAMKAVEAAEKALIGCGFGLEACDETKVVNAVQKSAQARSDAEAAWPKVVLALASLPKEQRSGAEKAAELGGCKEPWW